MAHKIDIRSGFTVSIPVVGLVVGPKTDLVISDATYEMISQAAFSNADTTKPLIDKGFVDASGDAVVSQAVNVAASVDTTSSPNATAPSAGYVQAEAATAATLANELKVDHNLLVTKVNAILTAFTGVGKPMAP